MTVIPADISAISAHLQLAFGPGGQALQYRRNWPELRILAKVVGTAGKATVPVEGARTDATVFHDEGADFPDAATVARKLAAWDYAEVALTCAVTDLAQGVANNNRLPSSASLMQSEVAAAIRRALDGMCAAFYTGDYTTSPVELAGLTAAGGSASFGGLSTSDIPTWAGQSVSPGAGSLAAFKAAPADYLREKLLDPIRAAGGSADVGFARSDMISAIKSSVQGADSQVRIRTIDGVLDATEIGTRAVAIDGCVLIESAHAPANKIAVISTESVEYQYVSMMEMTPEDMSAALAAVGRDVSPDMVRALLNRPSILPPFYFVELGRKATRREIGVAHQGQIAWRVRAHHGILTLAA